jgi:predicted DNA-binding transcriptional regulator AlpA
MTSNDRVGLAEVAAMLGVTKNTALRYTRRGDFPGPVEQLASGRVWRRRDVETWAKKKLPLPTGRPRQKPPPDAK